MKRLLFILWRTSKADLRALWFVLKHPNKPVWLLPAAVLLGLYAIAPFSYVVPFVGLVDDLVVVPMALHFMLKLLPESLRHNAYARR